MTDYELLFALKCCDNMDCNSCPLDNENGCKQVDYSQILDLIDRQKREIERLNKVIDVLLKGRDKE